MMLSKNPEEGNQNANNLPDTHIVGKTILNGLDQVEPPLRKATSVMVYIRSVREKGAS